MPHGKGTRKKYATGTNNDDQSLLSQGYNVVKAAKNPFTPYNKPLQKLDEAADAYPFFDSLIAPIAKGVNFL